MTSSPDGRRWTLEGLVAPGEIIDVVPATEVERLRRALERIANGSFQDADAAADFAIKAVEIAIEALGDDA